MLHEVEAAGWDEVGRAAVLVADTVAAGGLIHVFGTGHSHLMAEELFYRAGGLAQVNPILVDPLMLHSGAARSTRLERVPGLAAALLESESVGPDDLMIVVSNSGGNATGIEMLLAARDLGLSDDRADQHEACLGRIGARRHRAPGCTISPMSCSTTAAPRAMQRSPRRAVRSPSRRRRRSSVRPS